MKLVRALVALSALAASAALAGEKKHAGTPNCEVKGKKVHVTKKGELSAQEVCEKKKGTWLEATEAAAPAAAPAEATPAATPAEHK
jgi:hypothetical protein